MSYVMWARDAWVRARLGGLPQKWTGVLLESAKRLSSGATFYQGKLS